MVLTVTKTKLWCLVILVVMAAGVASLNGPNVCMVQQKYNITKRVKYRAPMSVRTYEWCFSMPPRCSKWKTEMRELTKLETDERIAEVAVCCAGYKMKDVSCVPICPNGKTGHRCSDDCSPNKWGPNCVNDCEPCNSGTCSPITGDCSCQDGWQGESCEIRMLPTTSTTTTAESLLTKSATKTTPPISTIASTRPASVVTPSQTTASSRTTLVEVTTHSNRLKPILEAPLFPNNTMASDTDSASNRTSLKTTSLEPVKTILSENSTSSAVTTTTTESATTTRTKANPATTPVTAAATTLIVTPESTVTTIRSREITTSIIATTVPTTTIAFPTTSIPITDDKPTEAIKATSIVTLSVPKLKSWENNNNTMTTTELTKPTTQNYLNIVTNSTTEIQKLEQTTKRILVDSKYNRTEVPIVPKTNIKEQHIPVHITGQSKVKNESPHTTAPKLTTANVTNAPADSTLHKIETTRRPESTIRYFPTTVKFKPKEIWIRPAQKGEPYKSKSENQDLYKPKVTQPNTTPKTIIVSIIPTSVSYATFKKIALTTTSMFQKTNLTVASSNGTEKEVTKPMSTSTTTESSTTLKVDSAVTHKFLITSKSNNLKDHSKSEPHLDRSTKTFSTFHTTREFSKNITVSKNGTNSMTTVDRNLNSSNFLTTPSTNAIRTTHKITQEATTTKQTVTKFEKVTRPVKIVTVKPRNVTIITVSGKNRNETVVKITKTIATDIEKTNATRIKEKTNPVTTESPDGEEFHILTEPEHITAVMEGKGKERSSVDLISVISIAGGIMMAVITVAVIIVMLERCKRPRYDNVRKVSDIRMQVMMDSDDVPPPYVRSIFHTPLPDPPTSEKCHYQPISTLDRNLKQFMRPVVVQTISPIMLENFRGILECHYDHLPRRSHHFDTSQRHCSLAPSVDDIDELACLKPCSAVDSIEALKCEARLDVIDSTTSEPLYAEIPCWRPPSEHAIEIMNLNGEAVTEL